MFSKRDDMRLSKVGIVLGLVLAGIGFSANATPYYVAVIDNADSAKNIYRCVMSEVGSMSDCQKKFPQAAQDRYSALFFSSNEDFLTSNDRNEIVSYQLENTLPIMHSYVINNFEGPAVAIAVIPPGANGGYGYISNGKIVYKCHETSGVYSSCQTDSTLKNGIISMTVNKNDGMLYVLEQDGDGGKIIAYSYSASNGALIQKALILLSGTTNGIEPLMIAYDNEAKRLYLLTQTATASDIDYIDIKNGLLLQTLHQYTFITGRGNIGSIVANMPNFIYALSDKGLFRIDKATKVTSMVTSTLIKHPLAMVDITETPF